MSLSIASADDERIRRLRTGWDHWSRCYRWLEYGLLGRSLEQARRQACDKVGSPKKVLLLGDGDGRFLSDALERWPMTEFVSMDCSLGMLARSKARNGQMARGRVQWGQVVLPTEVDVLPHGPFDTVVTAFFLDCFMDEELAQWMPGVASRLGKDGSWVMVDFTPAERFSGWRRWCQASLLWFLYRAFGLTTEMRARQMPEIETAFRLLGLEREGSTISTERLYSVTLWKKVD